MLCDSPSDLAAAVVAVTEANNNCSMQVAQAKLADSSVNQVTTNSASLVAEKLCYFVDVVCFSPLPELSLKSGWVLEAFPAVG